MNRTRRQFLAYLSAAVASPIFVSFTGCVPSAPKPDASGRIPILVAVDPIAFLVERVGAEFVDVAALTPQGKDPETFAPTPGTLQEVAESKLFFRVGLPIEDRFAKNIESIAPDAKTIDLREGLELLANPHQHDHDHEHEHGDDCDHDHDDASAAPFESMDAHLWTSPANARAMVQTIAKTLAQFDPEHADAYAANAQALDAELVAIQTEIATRLEPYKGKEFLVFHPAYGYYAREFGLVQRAIEFEGKAPRPRDLANLIEDVKKEGIKNLIVQPEFNRSSAQAVADAVDGTLVDHSPLTKDYFDGLRKLTDAIVGSFQ